LAHERKDYFPAADILAEAREVLQSHQPGTIDWVTFVGSGETLLCASLGWLIDQVKSLTLLPVAVITNGSYLYLPEVRQSLLAADAVMPSLDAGTAQVYRKINRPHPKFTFDLLVKGLVEFRQIYSGKYWLEVMLVRNLNDDEGSLIDIARCIEKIRPDTVHINFPTRPPVETWVQPPIPERLVLARQIFGNLAEVVSAPISSFAFTEDDLGESLVRMLIRHPVSVGEVLEILDTWSPGKANMLLETLISSGKIHVIERIGVQYCVSTGSYFPD